MLTVKSSKIISSPYFNYSRGFLLLFDKSMSPFCFAYVIPCDEVLVSYLSGTPS